MAEGGAEVVVPSGRGKGRRRKAKSKQNPTAMAPGSDGEVNWRPVSENQLTPSPTLLTNEGVDPVGVANHTHLAQLYQVVASQQREIAALRAGQERGFVALQLQLATVQSTVEEQRQMLGDHSREQQVRLEKAVRERQLVDRQRQDKLLSTVSQTLSSAVNAKLEKVVRTEMKTHVTPVVSRSLASVQEQLSSAVHSATDTALRDGIHSVLHTKGLPEAVGAAVAGSIRNKIQGVYEETFRSVVLPAFERSSQEMFRQLDEAFRRGVSEYLAQLQQQFHQLSQPGLQHLASSYHSLHTLLSSPDSPLLASLQRDTRAALQSAMEGVGESVRGVVREEVDSALQRHADSVNPEAKAMEERARRQEEIQRLLQSQEVNRAFETALSTSDLSLVLYLCQQVTAEEVFDKTPCPLSQPVLLSLIQQFSVDLSEHVDLKLRFLEASVLALETTNDITKSHMPQVLRTLTLQLASAEQAQRGLPNSASLLRSVRRLRMVTERLCHHPSTS
jgi:enhancer of mRNA-decapping protein 4